MTGAGAEGGAAQAALGRFVTVRFKDAPGGVGFAVVGAEGGSLRLEPLMARSPMPFVGEHVACQGTAGEWTTTALSTSDGVLELAAPRWLGRAAQRTGRRVPTDTPVTVRAGDEDWAGRLRDVSMRGAAVLIERGAGVRQGDVLRLEVPGGSVQATVRSVRHHQRLLVVLGVSFGRLEADALRWVAATVAGRSAGRSDPSESPSRG